MNILSTGKTDRDYINNIVGRVLQAVPQVFAFTTRAVLVRELELVHTQIMRLDLERMESWERISDLVHDLMGIHRHLDAPSLRLTYGFTPRFAVGPAA